jgi:hypothetical protein
MLFRAFAKRPGSTTEFGARPEAPTTFKHRTFKHKEQTTFRKQHSEHSNIQTSKNL